MFNIDHHKHHHRNYDHSDVVIAMSQVVCLTLIRCSIYIVLIVLIVRMHGHPKHLQSRAFVQILADFVLECLCFSVCVSIFFCVRICVYVYMYFPVFEFVFPFFCICIFLLVYLCFPRYHFSNSFVQILADLVNGEFQQMASR